MPVITLTTAGNRRYARRLSATAAANHCEVRQSGNRRIYVQHQRLADGGIVSLHTDITELDEARRARHQLHDDFLFTAESIQIGIWDWQVSRQPAGE